MSETTVCRKCGETREHHPNGNLKQCRTCSNARAKQWVIDNPKRSQAIKRKHYVANTEEVKARSSQWAKDNREHKTVVNKAWEDENRDKVNAFSVAWNKKNPEKKKASSQNYYIAHKEEIDAAGKKWKEENPERRKASDRAWVLANRDKVNAAAIRWREKHPEAVKAKDRRRRTLLQNLPYDFEIEHQVFALDYFDGKCAYCKVNAYEEHDHYIPLCHPECLGTVPENMVPSCKVCNRGVGGKFAKHPEDWVPPHIQDEIAEFFRVVLERENR